MATYSYAEGHVTIFFNENDITLLVQHSPLSFSFFSHTVVRNSLETNSSYTVPIAYTSCPKKPLSIRRIRGKVVSAGGAL